MAPIDAQAAAVGRQLLHVEDAQARSRRRCACTRVQREVGKVLVVDGVELGLLDQAHQVRKLEG